MWHIYSAYILTLIHAYLQKYGLNLPWVDPAKAQYSRFHNDCLFLAKKVNIFVPNAAEKIRTQDQTLSFVFRLKKDNRYENQSTWP